MDSPPGVRALTDGSKERSDAQGADATGGNERLSEAQGADATGGKERSDAQEAQRP